MTRRESWMLLSLWLSLGLLPHFLRPLWEPDEARYSEIPRAMLATGDWLTPRLNGVLYFEKPPLQYWLSACFQWLFGANAVASRLPLALASALSIWAAWRMSRRLGAREPLWAAVFAATCLLGMAMGQILLLDALFSAFLVAALACALEAVAEGQGARPQLFWTLGMFVAVSGAFLTKGLAVVVLTGGVLFFVSFVVFVVSLFHEQTRAPHFPLSLGHPGVPSPDAPPVVGTR